MMNENTDPTPSGYDPNAYPAAPNTASPNPYPYTQQQAGAYPTQQMPQQTAGAYQSQQQPGAYPAQQTQQMPPQSQQYAGQPTQSQFPGQAGYTMQQTQQMPSQQQATAYQSQQPQNPYGYADGSVPPNGGAGYGTGAAGGADEPGNSPTQDKKRHVGVIIAIVAFAVLLIAAGIAYACLAPSNEPRDPVLAPSISENVNVNIDSNADGSNSNADNGSSSGNSSSDSSGNSNANTNTSRRQQPTTTPAKDFTFYDLDDNPVSLSDFAGKPIVLNFWASWCGPCATEMPEFQEMYQNFGGQVTFLMVDMTGMNGETKQDAEYFIAENGYTFPIYFDTDGAAVSAYNITSIPQTYFIDAEGNIVSSNIGMLSSAQLERQLQILVS